MTLGAQLLFVPQDKHESIGRPVRSMTDTASLFFLGKMFKNPRTPLFRVTVETGFLLPVNARLPQTGPFTASVRGMAV